MEWPNFIYKLHNIREFFWIVSNKPWNLDDWELCLNDTEEANLFYSGVKYKNSLSVLHPNNLLGYQRLLYLDELLNALG